MATKTDLFERVKALNRKYCRNGKNRLRVSQAYGGYEVQLTGKTDKRCKKKMKWLKGSLGSGSVNVTFGHDTATKTLNKLNEFDSKGYVKSKISYYSQKR